ncbi:MAG: ribosome biogenesis/translation initiation ATPase RLI [Candidatus Huberarchaeum crystalense]|uniref:Ribosome biogenesis/translation initiation ATPase RLI n=1 Tax=Huberarchaeum crystalense TaxID=2014257 RepID=A0A2H9P8U9_HUBC1|nr:MAG: ribosome biogenesis/translation initiation ATPase RLI [Candidatus Huberarchaeum crystalense]
MRIAILHIDHCFPEKCSHECTRFCPRVLMGQKTIEFVKSEKYPKIDEFTCVGCGICTKKCPFGAIEIINLPEELSNPFHQYGQNMFRLFKFITLPKGKIVGLLGENGTGKSTILNILSKQIIPNFNKNASEQDVVDFFRRTQNFDFFKSLYDNKIEISYKPQILPKVLPSKKVKDIIKNKEIINDLELSNILEKDLSELSQGELQRAAIAITLEKNSGLLVFDEPSTFLDIYQRINITKAIRKYSQNKYCAVVEHDLLVLDIVADYINILYGKPGAFGIVSNIRNSRSGINDFLRGFLRDENVKMSDPITLTQPGTKKTINFTNKLLLFPSFTKTYKNFCLTSEQGTIFQEEIVGILGRNATGKSTFLKILYGIEKSDQKNIETSITISYKPQEISANKTTIVADFINPKNIEKKSEKFNLIVANLNIFHLLNRPLNSLSGGELQRVWIAACLFKEADIYLLDEPTAYLDVKQRLNLAKFLKVFLRIYKKAALVVDHDLSFLEYISDSLMLFEKKEIMCAPESATATKGEKYALINKLLSKLNITLRRDVETNRLRVNEPNSQKDIEQKNNKCFIEK